MNVDTGAFPALTAQVAELAEQVRQLAQARMVLEAAFAAGRAHEREDRTRRPAARPRYLRSVDGGAS